MIEKSESIEITGADTCWMESFVNMEREVHLIPVGDILPHLHSMGCWCGPKSVEGMVLHKAFDLREHFELDVHVC